MIARAGRDSRWFRLGVIAALALSAMMPSLASAGQRVGDGAGGSPLARVAAGLEGTDDWEVLELARIVLREMQIEYSGEVDRALTERGPRKRAADRASWARSTAGFVDRLVMLEETLYDADRIAVRAQPDGSVLLVVGREKVLVSSPRIGRQRDLEARIVEQFCLETGCPGLDAVASADSGGLAGIGHPPAATVLGGEWSAGDGEGTTYTTSDGLRFDFRDMRRMDRKREAAEIVVRELRELAVVLGSLTSQGVPVDWNAITVSESASGGGHAVRVNRLGDYVVLDLSALARAPQLVALGVPWLRDAARGAPRLHVFPHADTLLAALID
ncbi:MAG: hypothetical protein H6983_17540 [Ectothiorhodospiraceae bacterium]|nr:hypothetical protein [Chromatiales bacterium]MCP5155979.1 hypothetical protein [Ectothiorhodospiraceae bacterium]